MKRITKALAAITAVVALASCDTNATAADRVTGEELSLDVKEVTITLSDTRRVPCIILNYDRRSQAMSCDWAHADGSDNL